MAEGMDPQSDEIMGEAIYAGLVSSSILTTLVSKGVLSRQEAFRLTDGALSILERHRANGDGLGADVVDYARTRFESVIQRLQSIPGSPPT